MSGYNVELLFNYCSHILVMAFVVSAKFFHNRAMMYFVLLLSIAVLVGIAVITAETATRKYSKMPFINCLLATASGW